MFDDRVHGACTDHTFSMGVRTWLSIAKNETWVTFGTLEWVTFGRPR